MIDVAIDIFLYNNTPCNTIVITTSNIRYRPLIQTNVFADLLTNERKKLTNVVIGKLDI
jgi:hypothetical protein